jgi:hypothetical protein
VGSYKDVEGYANANDHENNEKYNDNNIDIPEDSLSIPLNNDLYHFGDLLLPIENLTRTNSLISKISAPTPIYKEELVNNYLLIVPD